MLEFIVDAWLAEEGSVDEGMLSDVSLGILQVCVLQ